MSEILGHDNALADILASYNSKRLHHAWLFSGIRGTGKRMIASTMAKFLLDKKTFVHSYGLECSDDINVQMERRSHPDLHFVDGAQGIKVADIRKVGSFLSMTPVQSAYKIVVITCVENMNVNAANALLKSLEEPEGRAVLIMTTNSIGRLLSTIKSRCRTVQLSMLTKDLFRKCLSKNAVEMGDESYIDYLHDISGGSPGVALEYINMNIFSLYKLLEASIIAADGLRLGQDHMDIIKKLEWRHLKELLLSIMHKKAMASIYGGQSYPDIDIYTKLQRMMMRLDEGQAYNLDKANIILSIANGY